MTKVLEIRFLQKNNMTGINSSVLHFDQNFSHKNKNEKKTFGVGPVNRCSLKIN